MIAACITSTLRSSLDSVYDVRLGRSAAVPASDTLWTQDSA